MAIMTSLGDTGYQSSFNYGVTIVKPKVLGCIGLAGTAFHEFLSSKNGFL